MIFNFGNQKDIVFISINSFFKKRSNCITIYILDKDVFVEELSPLAVGFVFELRHFTTRLMQILEENGCNVGEIKRAFWLTSAGVELSKNR